MTVTRGEPAERPPAPASANPAAGLMHRSLNLPNLITVSRLVLAVVLFALIAPGQPALAIPAAILFLIAAGTDAIDGYIARRYGLVTTVGRILDPFADKIIVCGTFIFLLEQHPHSGVSAWMVVIVVGREMFVTGLRSFLEQQGVDFSASLSGKLKMVVQCLAITASLLSIAPSFANPGFILFRDITLWLAVAVTFYSGVIYIWRAAQLLRP